MAVLDGAACPVGRGSTARRVTSGWCCAGLGRVEDAAARVVAARAVVEELLDCCLARASRVQHMELAQLLELR